MTGKNECADAYSAGPKTVFEVRYRARVEELWELWTTKEGFESWWGPVGFRAEVQIIEARPGGALRYDMIADTPEMVELMKQMGRPPSHGARGTFAEFRPYERLTLVHVIDFLPGVEPYECTTVAEFFPVGDRVRMVITLEPMHDEEFTKMSAMGFGSQLTKLDKRFGTDGG
jgi:uncharacterized protein YndB with AHSA1/START domain